MSRELFTHDPQIGFRFTPGVRTRVSHEGGGYLVQTNPQGFRSEHDFAKPKGAGKRRVLVFGDSYTAGDGVNQGARYTDILERRLGSTEIFNFALPGTGTDQHYLVWKNQAKSIPHDAVVIAVQVENIRRVASRFREFKSQVGKEYFLSKPYFELDEDAELELHGVPVQPDRVTAEQMDEGSLAKADRGGDWLFLRKAVESVGPGAKRAIQKIVRVDPLPAYNSADNADWKLLRAILLRWISEIAVPVVVMPLPLYHYIEDLADPSAYQARFAEIARDARTATGAHVLVHDPLPAIRSLRPDARRAFRFREDPHPTELAHHFYADSLAPRLEQILSVAAQ